MFKKLFKIIIIILIGGFIVIQFFRPERYSTTEITNDDITKVLDVPGNVQGLLKRSCYDCHSNQTYWPWYSEIAPISWLIADDVNGGRSKFNFSEWGKLSVSKQSTKLQKICDKINGDESKIEGEPMPLPKYLILHKDKVLSKAEKEILCNWANTQADSLGN